MSLIGSGLMPEQTKVSEPTARLTAKQTWFALAALTIFMGSLALSVYKILNRQPVIPALIAAGISAIGYVIASNRNKRLLEAQGGDSAVARLKSMLMIEHLAGLEQYNLSRAATVQILPEGLLFTVSKSQRVVLPWEKIQSVDAGSEEQLRSRVTLSRFLLVGVFALALKKERKQNFYLTVTTTDGLGLWALNTIGRDNRAMERKALTFSAECNSRAKAQASTVAAEKDSEIDVFEQIEKLAVLLQRGLITEDDFNSKKNELLRRI